MIFQGIALPIEQTDPEFARFEARLVWHYILARFTEFNNALVKAFNKFGESMRNVADSMSYMMESFNKANRET